MVDWFNRFELENGTPRFLFSGRSSLIGLSGDDTRHGIAVLYGNYGGNQVQYCINSRVLDKAQTRMHSKFCIKKLIQMPKVRLRYPFNYYQSLLFLLPMQL